MVRHRFADLRRLVPGVRWVATISLVATSGLAGMFPAAAQPFPIAFHWSINGLEEAQLYDGDYAPGRATYFVCVNKLVRPTLRVDIIGKFSVNSSAKIHKTLSASQCYHATYLFKPGELLLVRLRRLVGNRAYQAREADIAMGSFRIEGVSARGGQSRQPQSFRAVR